MKITYPNHSEPAADRFVKGVGRLCERAVTLTGWVIVVLAGVFVVALLARVTWSFIVLALKAVGEL